jgi:hypothetical protein
MVGGDLGSRHLRFDLSMSPRDRIQAIDHFFFPA